MNNDIRFIEPSVKIDGAAIHVSPAWGQCVRLEIDLGKREEDVSFFNSFSLCVYDLDKVDKLITDLTNARNEIATITKFVSKI